MCGGEGRYCNRKISRSYVSSVCIECIVGKFSLAIEGGR